MAGTYELFLGAGSMGSPAEAYGRTTRARQAAARRWLNPTQRSVVTLVPEDART
jgi:hypothetical protein